MSYQKWFVDERANGSCFSVAQFIQTKGNHLSTSFLCHVSDGLPRSVAELIASAPRLEFENKELLDQVQKLKDENAALKEQIQPTEKPIEDLPAGYGRGWSCY